MFVEVSRALKRTEWAFREELDIKKPLYYGCPPENCEQSENLRTVQTIDRIILLILLTGH